MSKSPSPSLVAEVQRLVLRFFEVSEEEARKHAVGLVALAEGWGSPKTAPNLDWPYRVKKDLGEKLEWKSEAEHRSFLSEREGTISSYEAYIKRPKRT